eukprot:Clim_evm55s151 gene=Clim_evmTU55s151
MSYKKGILTKEGLKKKIQSEEIDQVTLAFTDHYGRLCGKIIDGEFWLEEEETSCCNYLLAVDIDMNPVPGYSLFNWEKGYGDFRIKPDYRSCRVASWLDKMAIIVCDTFDEHTHELVPVAPRSVLHAQCDKLLDKFGFKAMGASELEFYTFRQSYREAGKCHYHGLEPISQYVEDYQLLQMHREEPFMADARRHLKRSGLQVENSKGEAGIGQHELNIRYDDVLLMADQHQVYKSCIKNLADSHNISVTFMAKPTQEQSGSSCHIHMSLRRPEGGKSPFLGNRDSGRLKGVSDTFLHFLAGWIKYTPDFMVCYAPTVNSYKRYISESWAPTKLAWCMDNRTAGFRIVGEGEALRIECRIPGADCNIYMAFAASLAAGMKGLEEKLMPPEMFDGDIYSARELPEVPNTLREAYHRFENSPVVKEAFGDVVQMHYSNFFKQELKAWEEAVTDWEASRYFERI